MISLQDLLYLNNTVLMSNLLLCPLYPTRQQSSDTLLYVASNDSQMNAKEIERLASTVMERVRYRDFPKLRHLCSTRSKEMIVFPVCTFQMELRPFLSDPELVGAGDGSSRINVVLSGRDGYQTLPSRGTNMRNPLEQV